MKSFPIIGHLFSYITRVDQSQQRQVLQEKFIAAINIILNAAVSLASIKPEHPSVIIFPLI